MVKYPVFQHRHIGQGNKLIREGKYMSDRNRQYIQVAFIGVLLLVLFGMGCTSQDKNETKSKVPQKPVIDQSTPDKAILSFWDMQIYDSELRVEEMKARDLYKLYSSKARNEILINRGKRNITDLKNEKKIIEKIEIQTDTRAVVYVKGPEYGPDSVNDDWKYILGKEKNVWVLEDILVLCYLCKGTGEVNDYSKANPNTNGIPKRKCDSCCGMGWRSHVYPCKNPK
jgi:hypothetical protein